MNKKKNNWVALSSKTFKRHSDNELVDDLPPGLYEFTVNMAGEVFFIQQDLTFQNVIEFDNTANDLVLSDIRSFWAKKDLFKKYEFPYKRGILLYGDPGTGKSITLLQISREIISLGGFVISFRSLGAFYSGMEVLRELHPEAPVVVLMEDLDRLLDYINISELLNLLDGTHHSLENIVYLATANNPELLHNSIRNRPSRFDRKVHFTMPQLNVRERYFEHLFSVGEKNKQYESTSSVDIDSLVKHSEGLSFAHMKELFLSSVCFGRDLIEVAEELRNLGADMELDDSTPYDYDDYEEEEEQLEPSCDPPS